MKKFILSILLLLISLITVGQKVDTIITTKAYQSYFSYGYKNPVLVSYHLHKGGGDCNRDKFHFKVAGLKHSSSADDYSHSGYDEGHMANAEDFAYDCGLDEMTFRFWNCMPQTPQLNRGIWCVNEAEIRTISQKDSLLIICGGFYDKKFIGDSVYVPVTCYKIVYSYTQKKVILSYIFTNTTTPVRTVIDYNKLYDMIKTAYKIDINNIIKK